MLELSDPAGPLAYGVTDAAGKGVEVLAQFCADLVEDTLHPAELGSGATVAARVVHGGTAVARANRRAACARLTLSGATPIALLEYSCEQNDRRQKSIRRASPILGGARDLSFESIDCEKVN